MQRKYEFMDLIVAIGLCATILGAGLIFLVANGTWQARTAVSESLGPSLDSREGRFWVQPILGQAIVDHYRMERDYASVAVGSLAALRRLAIERNRWEAFPFGYLDSIAAGAVRAEATHDARVQAVMGRSIVNATRRGVRSGVWSSVDRANPYNSRMIGVTEALGRKMDTTFHASWQPDLGRAIVTAGQERTDALAHMQERTGRAIVTVGRADFLYESGRGLNQEQLGGALVSAAFAERQATVSERPPLRQPATQQPAIQQTGERGAWPEIGTRYVVLASLALVGMFMAGVLYLAPLPLRRAAEV